MSSTAPPAAGPAPVGKPDDGGGLDRGVLAVAAVVVLGAIMSILDVTVVNVAIRDLSQEFDAPLSQIQWIATGYTLALATVIPVTGWAASRFGTKRLYMISIGLFVIGSGLAGMAWSAESLIAFRVLQGLGGGMIMPAGMTILTQKAGPQRVGQVMSVVGIPMLLGPISGPILGGWLVDDVSWRWIFYINVPIGIVALLMAWRILDRDTPQPGEKLDVLGLLLLSPGLATLIYGLATGAEKGAFDSTEVIACTVIGAALVIGFVLRALRAAVPLIDLRLFKRRSVATASGTMVLFNLAFFGAMLLMPLFYQVVRGESAFHTGLLLIPQGIGAMITMPIGGKLVDKIGPGRIVLGGLVLVTAGMAGFTSLIDTDTSGLLLGVALFVMGLGMGLTMMPTMSAAMQTLAHDEVPRASTALNIIQQVAGSIGTAAISVLLTTQLSDRLPGAGEGGIGAATNVPPEAAALILPKIADAFAATFWWATGLLVLAFIPALFLPRRKPDAAVNVMPMH
ncbi:DHA2 family efflux MFS transporter permease subunit [Actinocorallia sp. A-T 12471]|uniref:DHA2 family efflux MFS transporter permease subunit n=1 Tax=Actinocorallia sp. A-T 12471 TaxID=3089813 RepID=UPI0029CAD3EE|nr:DHA2 family efflux MFS transporter permease subunit [Actinocorallia sp. A-T 12471]MDX6740892.1 DHA2 family efflux MFS transporter permease subunit [Actinocorallia sp. A-T 12471]